MLAGSDAAPRKGESKELVVSRLELEVERARMGIVERARGTLERSSVRDDMREAILEIVVVQLSGVVDELRLRKGRIGDAD